MNRLFLVFKALTALGVAIGLTACTTAAPTIQAGPHAEVSYDGLHKVDNSNADEAWARPDIDLSGYTKLWPLGFGVEYRQVRDRGNTAAGRSQGGPYFVDEETRARFETLVLVIFAEELKKIERYELVEGPGSDVLIVEGSLLDVISFVPPKPIGGRSNIYLSSVGEATLVLELRDSESRTILARSIDRRAAETPGTGVSYTQSSSVSNAADVKRLIRRWAARLREGLDGFSQQSAE